MMKIYYISYFADDHQKMSIVTENSEEQAEKLVSHNCGDYQLIDIREIPLSSKSIIHTEIIEVI